MNEYTPEQIRASSRLQRYGEQRRQLEDNIVEAVHDCVELRITWRQIGGSLGTSGQAAWERYGLTPEQRQQRSRQNTAAHVQPTLTGLGEPVSQRSDHDEPAESESGD